MTLPIEDMLRDADRAWDSRHDLVSPDSLLGDLSCHVRALAAEVERLRKFDAARAAACKAILGRLRGRKGTADEGRLSLSDKIALKTIAGQWPSGDVPEARESGEDPKI